MDDKTANDELRSEYDEALLKNGVRGKYARRYAKASNVVRLDSDVATIFPNEEAVNEALRKVIQGEENQPTVGSIPEDVGQYFSDSESPTAS